MECRRHRLYGATTDIFEVFTDPSELSGVREALEAKGYVFVSAEPEKIPEHYTSGWTTRSNGRR